MRRRLFTFFSVLSLLLCVATVVLWVRSYRGGEMWSVSRAIDKVNNNEVRYNEVQIITGRGCCGVICGREFTHFANDAVAAFWHESPYGPLEFRDGSTLSGRLGFTRGLADDAPFVTFPLIVPMVVLAIVPIIYAFSVVRRKSKSGRCTCGYNLTGNTSGVCPECGVAFDKKANAAA